MPELPEVETVMRGLEPVMLDAVVTKADIRRPNLRWPFPQNMAARLEGAKILGLRRRSKYILCDLSSQETLLIHLGMSGRMLIEADDVKMPGHFYDKISPAEKHDHVVLDFDTGTRVKFNDARRFGSMDLLPTDTADRHPLLASLGPEPLGNDFHADLLRARFEGRRTPIKSALLDQKIIAGLGNIYVCEALWRSGISPKRLARNISAQKLDQLVPSIKDVLVEAIEAGGSSLKDHRQANGELGYFQHNFSVYGREGEPCRTDGCVSDIRRIVQSGRSSFYCPNCQR